MRRSLERGTETPSERVGNGYRKIAKAEIRHSADQGVDRATGFECISSYRRRNYDVVGVDQGRLRTEVNWWCRPDSIAAEALGESGPLEEEEYFFGRASLLIDCEDVAFVRRFREIFSECARDSTEDKEIPRLLLRVRLVRSNSQVLAVSLTPDPIEGVDFVRQLFPDRNYVDCSSPSPNWRMLALPEFPKEPVLAFGPGSILISRSHPWQHMVAMLAVSSAFRLQPHTLVFHAASVAINGEGVLLLGNKGVGKTTLSLCLASRGHAFLGDEWGAVSATTGELLPMRSLPSIRPGPHAKGVEEYLHKHTPETRILPDGTERVRARVGEMFPEASAQVVPFAHAFFLRGLAMRPKVQRIACEGLELMRISPLLATMSGRSSGRRAIELLRTLGKAHLWSLDVGGSPDETADLIEETLKEG